MSWKFATILPDQVIRPLDSRGNCKPTANAFDNEKSRVLFFVASTSAAGMPLCDVVTMSRI